MKLFGQKLCSQLQMICVRVRMLQIQRVKFNYKSVGNQSPLSKNCSGSLAFKLKIFGESHKNAANVFLICVNTPLISLNCVTVVVNSVLLPRSEMRAKDDEAAENQEFAFDT